MKNSPIPSIKLETFWAYQVTVLADQIARHTRDVAKDEAGLNLSQWRVLAAVAEKPDRTAVEVTSITPMDKTIVSRAVMSLTKAGYIQKRGSETDKRILLLAATETGYQAYEKIASRLNKVLVEALNAGTPPGEFIQILDEYKAHMAAVLQPKR